jgi:hypothetical protein
MTRVQPRLFPSGSAIELRDAMLKHFPRCGSEGSPRQKGPPCRGVRSAKQTPPPEFRSGSSKPASPGHGHCQWNRAASAPASSLKRRAGTIYSWIDARESPMEQGTRRGGCPAGFVEAARGVGMLRQAVRYQTVKWKSDSWRSAIAWFSMTMTSLPKVITTSPFFSSAWSSIMSAKSLAPLSSTK